MACSFVVYVGVNSNGLFIKKMYPLRFKIKVTF